MSPASAKAKPAATVTVERDRAVVAAARLLVGHEHVLEVVGPPFGAWSRSTATGSDQHVTAGDEIGFPGSGIGNAWLVDRIREADVKLVILDGHIVRHIVENASTLAMLTTGLQPVASATGVDVLLLDETAPPAEPAPTIAPPQHGEAVAGAFRVGAVHEVDRAAVSGMSHLIGPLGRDATIVSRGQDRLTAQRGGGSIQRSTWISTTQDQPAMEWLAGVVLSHEPRLLLVEEQALDRLDRAALAALATASHVAVGVLPGPRNPGHVTPESLLKKETR